jgi:hypothetical protein
MSEQFPKGLNQALARLVLANQRRRLAISLRRLARIDSADAPPKLSSDIEVARAKIARIKEILRADIGVTRAKIARIKEILRDYGEEVDHHPDDDAPAA